jgi:hypothetical protein
MRQTGLKAGAGRGGTKQTLDRLNDAGQIVASFTGRLGLPVHLYVERRLI